MNILKNKLTCFLPYGNAEDVAITVNELSACSVVGKIFVVYSAGATDVVIPDGCIGLDAGILQQTQTWKALTAHIDTAYTLLYIQTTPLKIGSYGLERMRQVIADTDAGMLFTDRYKVKDGQLQPYPVNDYQAGSLRDDFDFGSLLLYQSSALKAAVNEMDVDYRAAALYDLRLKVSKRKALFHLPEFLYSEIETDARRSGEKMFDYVDPKNRLAQIEMEQACTRYLKDTGAWLQPVFTQIDFSSEAFQVEATVVIPVRNREKTIEDAIKSVLMQKTDFSFNLIVVDNHSTDRTTEIISEIACSDKRLIHVIPQRNDLGIGGCWNKALMHEQCGKFAIQLDSDDMYINENVVQTIVNAFYGQNCAMIVGTYKMVNFQLEEIPPGIIDHKEWTPDNGRNNALRINGLGAPRAFYTPILRNIKIPNTSYGEDYAVGLAISRNYQIGRIYEPLYLCRRWDDNTDASLDVNKQNTNNRYKDCIRTIELLARKAIVSSLVLVFSFLLFGCKPQKTPSDSQTSVQVKTGIEVLRGDHFKQLEGKRAGLITNPTGVDSRLKSTIDILFDAPNVNLVALYSPEHGIRGNITAGEIIGDSADPLTGLPVFSLYGSTKKPTPEMLDGIDVLVYDMQDIGSRSYTYISTMGLAMEAAAENNIEFMVLDRPNPLGGLKFEGHPNVEPELVSLVSQFPITYVHGFTVGELATFLNKEGLLKDAKKCELTVVKMEGWKREMNFDATGLPWVITSPHVPHPKTAYYYVLSGILGELYTINIGVGYTLPFELFGAEWIDAEKLADALNALDIPGAIFRPIHFKPYYGAQQGLFLHGVQTYITDFEKIPLSLIQFYVLQELRKLHPEYNVFELCAQSRLSMFDKVCGTARIRKTFSETFSVESIQKIWDEDVDKFKEKAKQYFLY